MTSVLNPRRERIDYTGGMRHGRRGHVGRAGACTRIKRVPPPTATLPLDREKSRFPSSLPFITLKTSLVIQVWCSTLCNRGCCYIPARAVRRGACLRLRCRPRRIFHTCVVHGTSDAGQDCLQERSLLPIDGPATDLAAQLLERANERRKIRLSCGETVGNVTVDSFSSLLTDRRCSFRGPRYYALANAFKIRAKIFVEVHCCNDRQGTRIAHEGAQALRVAST